MTLYNKIKRKYSKNTIDIVKDYSKHNKQKANLKTSATFLIKCNKSGIIPNFIQNSTKNIYNIFKINNKIPPILEKQLEKHINNFHLKILKLLINQKHKMIKTNSEYLFNTKEILGKLLDNDDRELFIESEQVLLKHFMNNNKNTLIKKLNTLKDKCNTKMNIKYNNDWFVNTTNTNIPANVQWLLSLGPKFALPITKSTFPLFSCIAEGEECVQTKESREQQEISRTKLVSLLDDHICKTKLNTRDKQILDTVGQTEKFLNKNKEILILNSDKGNKTVAMEKSEYDIKMRKIVGDMCTYRRLKKDPTSVLQTKNNGLIDKLFNMNLINNTEKNKLTTRIATTPRIYGLPKIHKKETPLRPICSSINSPSYNLCKYLVDILKNLTKNSLYNVKDAIEFKSRIYDIKIEKDETLISFDVVSLFPSVPVNLAMKIIDNKWNILEKYTRIPKDTFMELLTFCIKDSRYFKYDDKFYEQTKGMPMGSPASPVIADIVMEELLDAAISKMRNKPKILTKYVDDIFSIIKKDDIDCTLKALNEFNRQIQFTFEIEEDYKLPYLDSIVHRDGNLLKLNWYQKSMSSGRLVNFYSKHPRRIIINTATNFIDRVLKISDVEFYKTNIDKIKNILNMNDFPKTTIHNLIKYTKNRVKKKTIDEENPPKIYKSLTYIPGYSERLKQSDIYNKDKYELALKTNNTLDKLFSSTKSKLPKEDKSNLVYKISCNGDKTNICQKTYVGTTKSKLKTRLASHKSDLKAVDKPLEQKTALAAHCTLTNHTPNFENVSVLAQERNYNRRYTLEMLFIIDEPTDRRLNFKSDTDKCAQIYRHTINKHKLKSK